MKKTGGKRERESKKEPFDSSPTITVIIVVYNAVKTLEKAILSVVNQTYNHVELVIVDGDSSDGTLDVIKKYDHQIDFWISEPDGGIYHAMNKGVRLANSDWIVFLGADDYLFDELHNVSKYLSPHYSVVYGDVYMPKKHCLYNGRFSKFDLLYKNICHQAMFYNSTIFEKRSFDVRYKFLSDYAFNISIFSEKKFRYVDILIAYYNDIDGSSSVCEDLVFKDERAGMIKKFFGFKYFMYLALRESALKFVKLFKRKSK